MTQNPPEKPEDEYPELEDPGTDDPGGHPPRQGDDQQGVVPPYGAWTAEPGGEPQAAAETEGEQANTAVAPGQESADSLPSSDGEHPTTSLPRQQESEQSTQALPAQVPAAPFSPEPPPPGAEPAVGAQHHVPEPQHGEHGTAYQDAPPYSAPDGPGRPEHHDVPTAPWGYQPPPEQLSGQGPYAPQAHEPAAHPQQTAAYAAAAAGGHPGAPGPGGPANQPGGAGSGQKSFFSRFWPAVTLLGLLFLLLVALVALLPTFRGIDQPPAPEPSPDEETGAPEEVTEDDEA